MKLFTTKQSSVVSFLLTLFILFGTSNTGYGQAIDPPLTERTPQIRDAIVAAVPGVNAADDVTAAHLSAITELDPSFTGITSLKSGDFNGLTALTDLNLSGNSIGDISVLADLTTLTTLYLAGTAISDISDLQNLTPLKTLYLTANSITDISVLGKLTALTELSLGENSVGDISALENLTQLKTLILDSTSISDISALENLTQLTNLSLSHNSISDVSILEDFTALTVLYVRGNPISDYRPLHRLVTAIKAADRSLTLDITIPPEFTEGSSTTRAVAENTASGTDIGTAVAAIDADSGDTLTYTLSGTDAAAFSIISISGQLQTNAALDFETKNAYSVTVNVSDGKGDSDAIDVTINVTNVNEKPMFSDGFHVTRTVAENTPPGTNIGAAISATDPDHGDTLTYSLFRGDKDSFRIDPKTGQLQTKDPLDYETKNAYTDLAVLVIDSSRLVDVIAVTINVTDVLEIDPPLSERTQQIQDAIVAAVPDVNNPEDVTAEHLAAITELHLILKGITSLKSGDFNGLTALTTLDMVFNPISDISPLKDLTNLTNLNLSDNSISDISPLKGLTKLITLDLSRNSISDISDLEDLTKLTSLDLRENSISDISALEDLTALKHLPLEKNSISDVSPLEDLTELKHLDLRENSISDVSPLKDLTELTTLYLNDNSISDVSPLEKLTSLQELLLWGNPISDYSPLRRLKSANPVISIGININNNPPVFTDGDSITRVIAENTAPGTNIGTAVSATDADNHTLTYSLGGTDADSFDIVRRSGQLQTKDDLDYETKSSYTVTVTVYDGNSGGDRITVTIDVTDVVNENVGAAPSLETSPIPENTALLTNFPNPFNPETWIPYQLAKPAEVTLTIYDIRGVVVRELKLGHQTAGVYHSRSRAIHWDGRNNIGEQVATGVYFYTLKAGDFNATRKLLIRK